MRPRFVGSAILTGLAVSAAAGQALAFAEDVCHPKDGGAMVDCLPLPAACQPVPEAGNPCLSAAVAEYAALTLKYGVVRSTIHADVTHLLAQAAGFKADDAYWIAAYAEVPDYGVFEPTDMNGAPVGEGAYRTAELSGFVRTDLGTGGFLFHFVPAGAGGGPIDGLHPALDDAVGEGMLVHLRTWAKAATGTSRPVCVAGLTVASGAGDYATGASCYPGATVSGKVALFGPTAYPFSLESGPQVIQDPKGGPEVTWEAFDAVVGGGAERISDARLGLYLHVLADRISHHRCSDAADVAGPEPGAALTIDMSGAECTQGPHVLRHVWETGVDFAKLGAADRTTEAALAAVYDELVVFAGLRETASASDAAARDALLAAVAAALQKPGAEPRVSALAAEACARGFVPFPGAPECPAAPDAGAGGSGASSGTGGSAGGGSSSGGGSSAGGSGGAAEESGGCVMSPAVASGSGSVALAIALLAAARRRRR